MADFKLDNISSFIDENNSNDNTYLSDFFELETNPKLNLHGKDNKVDTMKRILKQKEVNRNVDDRPLISIKPDKYSSVIEEKTKDIINNNNEYNELNKNKTIFDMNLNEIFYNITNVFNNFSKEYKSQLLLAKYKDPVNKNISVNNNIYNTSISSIIRIHSVAFVNYLKNNNTILYFGLILILLSLIIYIFNITIW